MNTLVFSQTKAIRCCQEIDEDHILIAGDEEIGIIHIGVNEYMDRSNIVQNPINISKL